MGATQTETPPDSVEQVRVRVLPDGRMDPHNAGAYLGYAPKTLANLRSQGKGPRWKRVGGRIFYTKKWCDDWIENGDPKTVAA